MALVDSLWLSAVARLHHPVLRSGRQRQAAGGKEQDCGQAEWRWEKRHCVPAAIGSGSADVAVRQGHGEL